MEWRIDKAWGWAWLSLCLLALVGAAVCGAWWHLWTAGVCAAMSWANFSEARELGGGGR